MDQTIDHVEHKPADTSAIQVDAENISLPTASVQSAVLPSEQETMEVASTNAQEIMVAEVQNDQINPVTSDLMDTENQPVGVDSNNSIEACTDTPVADKEMTESTAQELAPPVPSDYESSDLESDSSDSDDSSDDEPKKKAPMVDFDSDEESGVSVSATGLRTRHELDPPPVPEIQVEIPENATIIPLGLVSSMIDNLVIVETYISDQPQYLDAGSLLVLEDRKPLGLIFETFGPVSRPFYSIRFNSNADIDKERIIKGGKVFSVPNMAHYVLPGSIRDKGSDASNMYDEEVDDKEMEFSDDEKEMEHKKKAKQKARKPRQPRNNPQNPPQPNYNQPPMQAPQQAAYGQQYPHNPQQYYQQNPPAYGYQPTVMHPQPPQPQQFYQQQGSHPHAQPQPPYTYPPQQAPNQPNPTQSAEQARANRMMNMYQDMY
ncbi:hypothetical protein K7432_000650 [Basidiobolus ranarum]|uniref:H/ACA ribonucleoprotein complex non-core subunit NAF1 n=1 Tax=Basidiobolus ranarum TaxID=34480 RepID=A0ABR2X4C6_9FUNG